MIRLFFAVLLPPDVRAAIEPVQSGLRDAVGAKGIRFTTPEQLHYTLRFLGETPEERLPDSLAAGREVAPRFAPFPLGLCGLGAFPNVRHPDVFWVGANEGVPLLTGLAESLERALTARGFSPEKRAFKPHLTLARVKYPARIAPSIRKLESWTAEQNRVDKFGAFVVQSFALMRSELLPSGAVYTIVEEFPLSAV